MSLSVPVGLKRENIRNPQLLTNKTKLNPFTFEFLKILASGLLSMDPPLPSTHSRTSCCCTSATACVLLHICCSHHHPVVAASGNSFCSSQNTPLSLCELSTLLYHAIFPSWTFQVQIRGLKFYLPPPVGLFPDQFSLQIPHLLSFSISSQPKEAIRRKTANDDFVITTILPSKTKTNHNFGLLWLSA